MRHVYDYEYMCTIIDMLLGAAAGCGSGAPECAAGALHGMAASSREVTGMMVSSGVPDCGGSRGRQPPSRRRRRKNSRFSGDLEPFY